MREMKRTGEEKNLKIVNICVIANSGKTTLFNGLTGKNERVGNWYGVTTAVASGYFFNKNGEKIIVRDLPGSYFDGWTLEGEAAAREVEKGGAAVIIAEAAELEKALVLYKRVRAFTSKTALVINMLGELKKRGGSLNLPLLKQELGCEVVVAEVIEKNGVNSVKQLIEALFNKNCAAKEADFLPEALADKVLKAPQARLNKIDEFLFCKKNFLLAFILFCAAALYLAFGNYGIGKPLSDLLAYSLENFVSAPLDNFLKCRGVSEFLRRFICEGIIGSAGALLTFLPPLAVLQFFVCFATESGALARVAFYCDGVFGKAGLGGRAVFTFLTGLGCTAAGALAAEGLESKAEKRRAIMSLSFIPCSAKTPVFLYLLSFAGVKAGFLALTAAFVMGVALALAFAFLNKKLKKESRKPLIVEFPPYRLPKLKTVCKSLQNFLKSVIIKIGSTVFLVTAFTWILSAITPDFRLASSQENSLLALIGKKIAFAFYPAGIRDWRFSLAAVCGLFAKESVVSVLAACGDLTATPWQIICFTVFCALYSHCFTALSAIKKCAGIKYALHAFFFNTALAFAVCYALSSWLFALIFAVIIVVLSIAVYFTRKIKSPCRSGAKKYVVIKK